VFSAAVPGQGGRGHLNERWHSDWATLFQARGYDCYAELRDELWPECEIEPWYRQNVLCFVPADAEGRQPLLAKRVDPKNFA
jgi:hypothetical protein